MKQKTKNKSLGQATVEFALILPILLVVIFGIFEVSRAIFNYSMIYAGAREGVRFGSSVGDADGDGLLNFQDYQDIKDEVMRFARFASVDPGQVCVYFATAGVYAPPASTVCTGSEFTYPSKADVDTSFGDYRVVVYVEQFFDTVAPVPLPQIRLFAFNARTIGSNIPVNPQ